MKHAGFTLVELVVTLAVAGVLIGIAVPSYSRMIAANRLSTATNSFVASLNSARMEAVRRNRPTQFCSNSATKNSNDTLGAACGTAGGAAFALNSDGSTTKLQSAPMMPNSVTVAAGITALRYSGQGLGRNPVGNAIYTGLLADISSSQISTNNHRCIYVTTGSIVSVCTRSFSTGACPSSEPADCQQQQ
jgi:type IV fimbrial biogenesis protein FimT